MNGDTSSTIRPDRRREEHAPRSKALTRSLVLCVGAFVGAFAVGIGMTLAGMSGDTVLWHRVSLGLFLVVGASTLHALWTYVTIWTYRCPRCGGRTVMVGEALPEIHKYCPTCNVEWITGLSKSDSLD
jgi:hypothetical protein